MRHSNTISLQMPRHLTDRIVKACEKEIEDLMHLIYHNTNPDLTNQETREIVDDIIETSAFRDELCRRAYGRFPCDFTRKSVKKLKRAVRNFDAEKRLFYQMVDVDAVTKAIEAELNDRRKQKEQP